MIEINKYDIIYLSYDEPNAEENWSDLKSKIPWAKRVHGIKGSDNAHKECAKISDTERFITIDGDNKINKNFINSNIDEMNYDPNKTVISWSAINVINNLVYGNGGIKCWPKDVVLNMKTHENAETEGSKVDFCWDINYKQIDNIQSVVFNNASPLQAFRAGFREGVKMGLDRGFKINPSNFKLNIHDKNYQRLLIWCNVGSDVENGKWSMLGARIGCYKTNLTDWDYTEVADFDWLNDFFDNYINGELKINEFNIDGYIEKFGDKLEKYLDIEMAEFSPKQSKFFKQVYVNPLRNSSILKFPNI